MNDYFIEHPILMRAPKVGGKKSKSKGIWDTLILRPSEFKQISNMVSRKYEIIFSALLLTGMRYEELVRFRQHPEWFDGSFIHLPPETGQKKVKRQSPERWVRLSIAGKAMIKSLFDISLPSVESADQYIHYTFPLIEHFSVKSFRKTWESWLVFYYPGKEILIAESQGHTSVIQFKHYLNMPFTDKDRLEMKDYVEGWA